MTNDVDLTQATRLTWGIKQSFRAYVRSSGGAVGVAAPAEPVDDVFAFPRAETDQSPADEVRFGGGVRFDAHGGMLSVALLEPWLVLGPSGGEVTVVDTDYLPDLSRRLTIARLVGEPSVDEAGRVAMGAALTAQGSRLLGDVYPAQTVLDPVLFDLPASSAQ
jgi:Htaa protein